MPYSKPYLTIPQQRELLEGRGMEVPEPAKAEEYLRRIGYYRLSAYCYPFRALAKGEGGTYFLTDRYKAGTQFKHVTDLYAFDKALRLLALDAIERIEISLRTEVALTIGVRDPTAHRDPQHLDRNFTLAGSNEDDRRSRHEKWLQRLDDRTTSSKEEFAEHFRTKYPDSHMPVWIAVELLDFGPLSMFISGMKYSDLQAISTSYGGLTPHLIKSWVRCLNGVRNVCAHHARLWNKPLVDQPALPKAGHVPELDHLNSVPGHNRRLYASLAIMRLLLKQVNPRTKWADRVRELLKTFPQAPNVTIADAGFPHGWDQLPLWN